MRVGKDVCPVLPRSRDGNSTHNDRARLNAGNDQRPDYVVRVLTKRAILVRSTIRMEVNRLEGSYKEEQYGNE
jgi:hypothetical protein